jgi:hypothetical protein
MQTTVTFVGVGLSPSTLVTTAQNPITLSWEGVEGDTHAGLMRKSDAREPHYPRGTLIRNHRQVSLVSAEELAEVATAMQLPHLLPEWLGANICLSGIPNFTQLAPATRLFFSDGAVLMVTYENLPCVGPGKVIQAQFSERGGLQSRFPKAALHKRGLVAVVEKPGTVRLGEGVAVKQLGELLR